MKAIQQDDMNSHTPLDAGHPHVGTQPLAVVDLAFLAETAVARQPVWACASTDLNANLLVLADNSGIASHVNDEVDVLLVGIAGSGSVEVEGSVYELRAGQALLIPKGTQRAIRSDAPRFAYLTCHQRRLGLWPQGVQRPTRGTAGSVKPE